MISDDYTCLESQRRTTKPRGSIMYTSTASSNARNSVLIGIVLNLTVITIKFKNNRMLNYKESTCRHELRNYYRHVELCLMDRFDLPI